MGNAESRNVITVPPNPLPYPLGIDEDPDQASIETRLVINSTSKARQELNSAMAGGAETTTSSSLQSFETSGKTSLVQAEGKSEIEQERLLSRSESGNDFDQKVLNSDNAEKLATTITTAAINTTTTAAAATATATTETPTTGTTTPSTPTASSAPTDKIILDGSLREEYELFLTWLKARRDQNVSEPVLAGCKSATDVAETGKEGGDLRGEEQLLFEETFDRQRSNFRRKINQLHIKTYSEIATSTTAPTRAPFVRRIYRTTTKSTATSLPLPPVVILNSANRTAKLNRGLYQRRPLTFWTNQNSSKSADDRYQPLLRERVKLVSVFANASDEAALKFLTPMATTMPTSATVTTTSTATAAPFPGKKRVVIKKIKKNPALGPIVLENLDRDFGITPNQDHKEPGKVIRDE